MSTIADNISQVRARINAASQEAGRAPNSVQLLAVSKTKPAEMVASAYACGQRDFGENYLQDALEKIQTLAHLDDINWHFIGPVQSNKTRPIAEHFAWLHSLDRDKVAHRLNDQRPSALPPLNVCLQVNISGEASKSGVSLTELPALAEAVSQYPNLRLRGLMAIPEACDNASQQHAAFKALADAFSQLQTQLPDTPLDTLSMGMTADLEAAIAEGSTWVRIGTAIFGARNYSH